MWGDRLLALIYQVFQLPTGIFFVGRFPTNVGSKKSHAKTTKTAKKAKLPTK